MFELSKAWITSLLIATAVGAQELQTVHLQRGDIQGSGVLCGGTSNNSHRVILSVAHVTGLRPGTTMIATINGRRYKAHLVGADYHADSALLVVLGRHLENVEPARLWMGAIESTDELRTEGFSDRRFIKTRGNPNQVTNGGRFLEWTAASYPGMSGGPNYLLGKSHPTFVTTTTGSDYRTMSVGPYRTWFTKWVPTLKTQNYQFTCSSSGVIQMIPRSPGRIEGPIAVPRPPSEEPISETQAEAKPDIDELREQLGSELKRLLEARPTRPEAEPELKVATQQIQAAPAQQVEAGQVVELMIPVKVRVKVNPTVTLEVIE